jgi:hypothetical protein
LTKYKVFEVKAGGMGPISFKKSVSFVASSEVTFHFDRNLQYQLPSK